MRNLLWRGISLGLAGCISWLLWNWPSPTEPVEFELDTECLRTAPQPKPTDCLWKGEPATLTVQSDGSILITVEGETFQ